MTNPIPVWQERVAPPAPDLRLLRLPGVDQLRAVLAEPARRPPLARLAGLDFVHVDEGAATFRMAGSAWLAGPKGTVHPGFLAWLADSPLALSVLAAEPPAVVTTTAELSLTFPRPGRVEDGPFTAVGTCLTMEGTDGLSQVTVTDAAGGIVAHGTSRVVGLPIQIPDPGPPEPPEPEPYLDVEPWQRPVRGETLCDAVVRAHTGLELLRAQIDGGLPLPPIHHLTGITPTEAAEGVASFSLPTGPWSQTVVGTVYGGALSFLASSAVSGAAQTLAEHAGVCDSLDLKVNFLRPVVADGRPLQARGEVQHAGRRLVVSSARVTDADGQVVALATGSTRLA